MAKKILIADDEQNIVISLEFLMKREGFTVCVATDGQEAIDKVRSEAPDLVLLDIMMPRKNGYEVCQEIRTDPGLQGTRILMLTAKGREMEITKARRQWQKAKLRHVRFWDWTRWRCSRNATI